VRQRLVGDAGAGVADGEQDELGLPAVAMVTTPPSVIASRAFTARLTRI